MKINPSFTNIGLSPIVEISERAAMIAPEFERRTGKPFIYLQRGDVGFDTPDYIKKAVVEGLYDKKLTRYPKSGGNPWFKDAILQDLSESGINGLNRNNILATYGGQEGLELVFHLFEEGKGVSFNPVWSCMLENVLPYSRFDTELVRFLEKDGNLSVDYESLEERLSETPKEDDEYKRGILYVNTPHNPTGKVFSREELGKINDLCKRYNFFIVSDEAYKDIVFDGKKHVSMVEFPGDHIVSVFTFSKTFAVTGFRIGYVVSRNEDIVEKLTRGNYTQTAGVVPFIQYALKIALEQKEKKDEWIAHMVNELQGKRDAIHPELKRIFGENVYKPQGAFYFFLNFNSFLEGIPVKERDKIVLEKSFENGFAIIPGSTFSINDYYGHARISYSMVNTDMCLEGIHRIEKVLRSL